MISSRELRFVNKKEQEIPYPGEIYSKEALMELKNAIYLYDAYHKDREHDVMFSNGENIEFEIARNNLSHIVGINHNNLIQQNFITDFYGSDTFKNSYDILMDIVENIDDVLKLNKLKDYALINFYRVKTRSEVFSKFSDFSSFNFGCILFDKTIAEENDYRTTMKSDKFLFTESDDPNFPYYMMGIAADENSGKTYVETLFPNNDPEKILLGQTIVMPTVISTTMSKEYIQKQASASQKARTVKSFNNLAEQYKATFSYFHDYYATLASQARNDERQKVLGK